VDLINAALKEMYAHGPGLLIMVVGGLSLILLIRAFNRKPAKIPLKTPDAVAQSLAEPDPDKELKGKPYTYEDYIRDIRDGNVELEEILRRCGGVIPEKPKDAPEVKYTDRMDERMRWFEKMAKENPGLKMTKPPVPIPVLLVKGQVVRCKCCCHGSGGIHTTGFIDHPQPAPGRLYCSNCRGKCRSCGGTGYMIIT
jgi:hypothetical protein